MRIVQYRLPVALALAGSVLCGFSSLLLLFLARADAGFTNALLVLLTSAVMGAGVGYCTGVQLIKSIGLPSDATMAEFHRFIVGEH